MTTNVPAKTTVFANMITAAKEQFTAALADRIPIEYFIRTALTAMRTSPRLLQCEPNSVMRALMQAAQLGLIPDGTLGHAYLVPYFDKNSGKYHAEFQIGFRGLIALAHRSINLCCVDSEAVYEQDTFSFEKGTNENLKYIKSLLGNRGNVIAVWAMITYPDGRKPFEVMTKAEVEDVKKRSKATSADTPWRTDYDAMARKTVLRRLLKYQPISSDVLRAVVQDEYKELGVNPETAEAATTEELEKMTEGKMNALKQELQATEVNPDTHQAPVVHQHPEPPEYVMGAMTDVDEPLPEPEDVPVDFTDAPKQRFAPETNAKDFASISLDDKRDVIRTMLTKAGKPESWLKKKVENLTDKECRDAWLALAATIESKA